MGESDGAYISQFLLQNTALGALPIDQKYFTYRAMTNFVSFQPGTEAPRHVHEEEQIVIVLDGEFTFDLDGDVRVMRKGDVAVVPAWVPHGAWTTDSHCLEVDVFCPPRQSLLKLAEAQAATAGEEAERTAREQAVGEQVPGGHPGGA